MQPHHDTKKANSMFGTMAVQLPYVYDGGVLRVCHHGEEMTFDFSGLNGMTEFHYAAFYDLYTETWYNKGKIVQ